MNSPFQFHCLWCFGYLMDAVSMSRNLIVSCMWLERKLKIKAWWKDISGFNVSPDMGDEEGRCQWLKPGWLEAFSLLSHALGECYITGQKKSAFFWQLSCTEIQITELYDNSIFDFLKNRHTVFHSSSTILYYHQQSTTMGICLRLLNCVLKNS